MTRKYFEINENHARIAHDMMSFRDYQEGSATSDYQLECDKVYDYAEKVIERRPTEAERVEWLAQSYAKKLADYYNRESAIGMMCPSVMISGSGNFPTKKKQRQIAAWDSNHDFLKSVEKIKDKLESILNGSNIILSDDERAIEKLEEKLQDLKDLQEKMREANKALRIKDIEEGNDRLRELGFSEKAIAELRTPDFLGDIGFAHWALSNNNQELHRIEKRLENLKAIKERGTSEQEYKTFKAVENTEAMRFQIVFDSIPAPEVRTLLKSNGFKWAPSQGAWQRQITGNGRWAFNAVIDELKKMEEAS